MPNDHTVSSSVLAENGTRLKFASKLKVLLTPRFRSWRVAKRSRKNGSKSKRGA
jgi:hypothetical protein